MLNISGIFYFFNSSYVLIAVIGTGSSELGVSLKQLGVDSIVKYKPIP